MAEPTATGTFTRRQAPEGEVSSSLAAEVWRVPNWSSQETSTTAIMAVLGSVRIALILSLCIGRNWKWFRGVSVRRWGGVSVGRDDLTLHRPVGAQGKTLRSSGQAGVSVPQLQFARLAPA